MKKIEITLNPKFFSADDVITELLRFFNFVRFSVFIIIIGILFKIIVSFYFLIKNNSTNDESSKSGQLIISYIFVSYNGIFYVL